MSPQDIIISSYKIINQIKTKSQINSTRKSKHARKKKFIATVPGSISSSEYKAIRGMVERKVEGGGWRVEKNLNELVAEARLG